MIATRAVSSRQEERKAALALVKCGAGVAWLGVKAIAQGILRWLRA